MTMKFETSRFGQIEASEDRIINFPSGLPGFSQLNRYVLIDYKDTPLKWLQSVDDPQVAFIVADPKTVSTEGSITIGDDVVRFLKIEKEEDLAVLIILRSEGDKVIANLKGPLAINSDRMLGVQAVIDQA
ncbi:MAG: flagellar assembly protein FliW [Syntrophorhabdaceae bacterium]|nr:flagellar assembly protein FliW [Syntrophorhabdaceae bacterium]